MIDLAAIRAFCNRVVREFHPEKIILFGSYAYGKPTADSDVDLLVILPRTRQRGEAENDFKVASQISDSYRHSDAVRVDAQAGHRGVSRRFSFSSP
jgi:predicted nucleotidyltransferase